MQANIKQLIKQVFTSRQKTQKSRLTPNTYFTHTDLLGQHTGAIIQSGKKETRRFEKKEAERSVGATPPLPHATTRGYVGLNIVGGGLGWERWAVACRMV